MAKNGQNLAIECFYLYVQNSAINFYNFWYGNSPCVLLWENHSVYAGKILTWPKFGHLLPKFLAKIDNLRVYDLLLSNAAMNHLYFWYGIFSYGLLWENHTLYAGKIMIWRNFDHLSHFWPKLTVLRVLAYNFQTPLWILLSFGMEVVLLVFFEKIILYIPGKLWYGKIVGI